MLPETYEGLGGQYAAPHLAPKSEQDRLAAKLWDGGRGRGNWEAPRRCGSPLCDPAAERPHRQLTVRWNGRSAAAPALSRVTTRTALALPVRWATPTSPAGGSAVSAVPSVAL